MQNEDIEVQRTEQATPAETETAARARAIRARLPGQVFRERLDAAAIEFGPLYTLVQIRERVAETLPSKFGYRRTAVLEPIESYRDRIPDDALLKYDAAVARGLFTRFWVATPAYREERQIDPWIIGEVADADAYAVIARWE
jgi:hypothetical protein